MGRKASRRSSRKKRRTRQRAAAIGNLALVEPGDTANFTGGLGPVPAVGDLAYVEPADAATFAGTIGPAPINIVAVVQRQLSRGEDPDTAIDKLNADIRRERLRLYRDGQGVQSNWFNEHLRVILKRENGRPVAQMVELRAAEGTWAVSDIPQPATQHNPSRSRNPLGSRKRVPRSWIRVRQIAAEKWPNGYDDIEYRHLVKIISDKTGYNRDVILRALGLREG